MSKWEKFHRIQPAYKLAREFFNCKVNVAEKIHGSNASIMAVPEERRVDYYSRTQRVTDAEDGNFAAFRRMMEEQDIPRKLMEKAETTGYPLTVYGELYGSKVQNCGLDLCRYLPPGEFGFVLFAVKIHLSEEKSIFYDWDKVLKMGEALDLPVVPLLFEDIAFMDVVAVFEDNDSLPSLLAKQNGMTSAAEGVVVMTNPVLFTCHGEPLIGKLKTRQYEKHGSEKTKAAKVPKTIDPTIVAFANRVVTVDRVASIYSQAEHPFKHDMADMQFFVKEQLLFKDIETEEGDDPVWTPKDDEDPDKRRKAIRKEVGRMTAGAVKAYLESYHMDGLK
jgi:hypothetical protein